MLQKIWYAHCVAPLDGDNWLLYIDRHLVNEVTSPQAFAGLRTAGRHVRRPENTIAVADHNVPTEHRNLPIADEESRVQVSTLETNVANFGEPFVPLHIRTQALIHLLVPELGINILGLNATIGGSQHTITIL